jgi:hypothetical protein
MCNLQMKVKALQRNGRRGFVRQTSQDACTAIVLDLHKGSDVIDMGFCGSMLASAAIAAYAVRSQKKQTSMQLTTRTISDRLYCQ